MIKAWLTTIAGQLAERLIPVVVNTVASSVEKEIRARIPEIIRAVVAAVAETAGQLSVDTVDKVTDIIPGDLDDQVFDSLVGSVLDRLGIPRR